MSDPTDATPPGRLLLVRHGRTEWARTGQHTGRTDVGLDDVGRTQARALPPLLHRLLAGQRPAAVFASPLSRAAQTAQLAGLGALAPITVDDDLMEWDYGAYEGLTTPQIRELRGDAWTAFADGMAPGGPGQFPGESLQDVAARGARVLARVRACWAGAQRDSAHHDSDGRDSAERDERDGDGRDAVGGRTRGRDVVCVGHGHALRILATVWLGLPPAAGAALLLDPAAVCVLDAEHGVPGIRYWNLSPALAA